MGMLVVSVCLVMNCCSSSSLSLAESTFGVISGRLFLSWLYRFLLCGDL